MKNISKFSLVFILLLIFSTDVSAEYQLPTKPSQQCWHYNCWTYGNNQVVCGWEVETCDGRYSEFRAS